MSSNRVSSFVGLSLLACALAGCPQTTNPDASGDTSTADTAVTEVVTLDEGAPDVGVDTGTIDAGFDAGTVDAFDAWPSDVPPFDAVIDSDFDAPLPDSFTSPDGETVCNMTVNDGSPVTLTAATGTPPIARGGTITPGHYTLTAAELYAPFSPGGTLQSALDLTTTHFMLTGNVGMGEQRTAATYSLDGPTMHVMPVCPAGMTNDFQYTTSATTIQLQFSAMGFSIVLTYTLH